MEYTVKKRTITPRVIRPKGMLKYFHLDDIQNRFITEADFSKAEHGGTAYWLPYDKNDSFGMTKF